MSTHQIVTADYRENQSGGIMICGINFGFSKEDEQNETKRRETVGEPRSFFSDLSVNQTGFRSRILDWLSSWGLAFATMAGKEGAFERSFFQTNWLDTQTRSVDSDEKISKKVLLNESAGILSVIEERCPSVILFFGVDLIEVFNDISIRDRLESVLGGRSGNPENLTADLLGYIGQKFTMRVQQYGDTSIISVPHPNSHGLTNEYIAALRPPKSVMDKILAKMNRPNDDLIDAARKALSDGGEFTISFLQRTFKLGHGHAIELYRALEESSQAPGISKGKNHP